MQQVYSSKKAHMVFLGVASAGLYFLLFKYSGALVSIAERTPNGHALYAIIPVVIAFAFSLVHGTFTGHFWEVVGLKANHKKKK